MLCLIQKLQKIRISSQKLANLSTEKLEKFEIILNVTSLLPKWFILLYLCLPNFVTTLVNYCYINSETARNTSVILKVVDLRNKQIWKIWKKKILRKYLIFLYLWSSNFVTILVNHCYTWYWINSSINNIYGCLLVWWKEHKFMNFFFAKSKEIQLKSV